MRNAKTASRLQLLCYDWFVLPRFWNTWEQFASNLVYATAIYMLSPYPVSKMFVIFILGVLFMCSLKKITFTQTCVLSLIVILAMVHEVFSTFVIASWQGVCLFRLENDLSKPIKNSRGYEESGYMGNYEFSMMLGVFKMFLLVVLPYIFVYQISWNSKQARELRVWQEISKPKRMWK